MTGRAPSTVDDDYRLLRERLDRSMTGAPDSPTLQRILRRLFTPEDARLARQIPAFTPLAALASRTGLSREELDLRITEMARKGLVVDMDHSGERVVALAPVVIGFYEFTFMRTGDDAPDDEIARLFEEYFDEGDLPRAIFQANTQIGRSLVREESLPEELPTEVLDWERTSAIIAGARSIAVANCPCRVHAGLLGRACDAPVRTCLSFDEAADAFVKSGLAEAIDRNEAMSIVTEAKAAGLAQTADNVQRGVAYICNCCGCCCGMMRSLKRFDIPNAIVSSNWIAAIDHALCRGCGRCVKACPAGALHLELTHGQGLRRNWAVLDADRCLGCGVCSDACRYDAHSMVSREKRTWVPESTFERVVAMAIERGKLGDLLFDMTDARGARATARILHVLEQTSPARALIAIEPLKSVFLKTLVATIGRAA